MKVILELEDYKSILPATVHEARTKIFNKFGVNPSVQYMRKTLSKYKSQGKIFYKNGKYTNESKN